MRILKNWGKNEYKVIDCKGRKVIFRTNVRWMKKRVIYERSDRV